MSLCALHAWADTWARIVIDQNRPLCDRASSPYVVLVSEGVLDEQKPAELPRQAFARYISYFVKLLGRAWEVNALTGTGAPRDWNLDRA